MFLSCAPTSQHPSINPPFQAREREQTESTSGGEGKKGDKTQSHQSQKWNLEREAPRREKKPKQVARSGGPEISNLDALSVVNLQLTEILVVFIIIKVEPGISTALNPLEPDITATIDFSL